MPISFENSYDERLQVISDSVQWLMKNAVEGDIVEFGVARGYSIEILAATMKQFDPYVARVKLPPKTLHVFDSFKGFPEASLQEDINSPMVAAGVWAKGKCNSPGLPEIASLINRHLPRERVTLYPGWFKDTLSLLPKETRFALAHVDCDLYESSSQVLSDLFGNDRLADGCVLLLDDLLANRASPRFGQRRAWEECLARYAPTFTDLGFYGPCGWRCIVHKN